jgi:SAM-dependent methyltransferase
VAKADAYEYESFVAEYYDFNPVCAARKDVGFYVDLARAAGGLILELGCGTGRILLPTAAAGCRIVGLDAAEPMLAKCRAKIGREPRELRERVRLVRASMTRFDLGETFHLITAPFRSFQHLRSVDDQLACLRSAHRQLVPGGRLVLDLFQTDARRMHDPAFLQESQAFPEVQLPDGRRLRLTERTAAFHRAEQCNDVELIYNVIHPDGRTERLVMAFTVRYFFRYEVEHLLARCGFQLVALYGGYDRSPLADDSPEMVFLAEKSAG